MIDGVRQLARCKQHTAWRERSPSAASPALCQATQGDDYAMDHTDRR